MITRSDDITPEWLTTVLKKKVRSVDVILTKALPISTVHRLSIDYENADGPRALFLKLSGSEYGGAGKEVEFYNEVAPGIGCPPLIKCYDASFSEGTGRSHVLMEDLFETHTQPEQKCAPSLEMSRRAVEALAKVHSSCWTPSISDLGFRISDFRGEKGPLFRSSSAPFDGAWLSHFIEDLNRSVAKFLEAAELPSKEKEAYARMLANAARIWGRLLRQDDLTATHGDMHWWNFLYPVDADAHSVHIFDWHLWHIDLGARDLAFLLALGGFAEPRPEIEEELLHAYYDALGVADYSWEMLVEDYRWSAIRNLNIPVIFFSQGKHESTWRDALRRAFDSYERLGCAELL